MAVLAFNPSTRKQRQVDLCELKASLVYRTSSRQSVLHSETKSSQEGGRKNKTIIEAQSSKFFGHLVYSLADKVYL